MARRKRQGGSRAQHDVRFLVRGPHALIELVDQTARRRQQTMSAYIRQALIAALVADGVNPPGPNTQTEAA